MLVLCLLIACAIHANAHEKNGIRSVKDPVKDYVVGAELRKAPYERRIFDFTRNGVKIDVKVVVPSGGDPTEDQEDDHFPEFPVRDIGKCIVEFSLGCIRRRFVRFLETVGRLDEITLLGRDVKLVRNERAAARSDGRAMSNDTDVSIERTVDDLFGTFILRITLPRWNGKRGRNQIDVMMDETAAAEGRKKGGGGGGGGKGGGRCKMMMMGMLMMVKMKLMGVAALKGMMMGGMSLMVAMMMLMHKKMGKGGPWQSGGGGPWQGGGGHLKEIVLLTKSSGGGGHGSGGCCGGGGGHSGHGDSYGAPPSSSYGAPSGGGGGYGGSSGWGRSFDKRPMTLSYDDAIKAEPADGSNHTPMIGEVISNAQDIDYPDYQDYQKPPPIAASDLAISNWNATDNVDSHEYGEGDVNAISTKDNSKVKPKLVVKGRSFIGNTAAYVADVTENNVNSVATTSARPDVDVVHAMYMDEWQATAEKISANDAPSTEVQVESRRTDSRPNDIPLLRSI